MDPMLWIPPGCRSVLDVGCNAGALLADCARAYPNIRLAGVDVNQDAVPVARKEVPRADIRHTMGQTLPFSDGEFDCVTCIEVIEHIPQELRAATLREIHRVLAPGGRFVLRCPHEGAFAWLDSNNFRFRLPWLYNRLVGKGKRDFGYARGSEDVVWHHHFTKHELGSLVADGFVVEHTHYGGLFLFPIADVLSWPFYRRQWSRGHIFNWVQRLAHWDISINYGTASFTIMMVLKKEGAWPNG